MTDSDSINPFAAPRQPTISTDPIIGNPILYEATPTIEDLNTALRPFSAISGPIVWLFILAYVSAIIIAGFVSEELSVTSMILLLATMLSLGSLAGLHLRSKIYAAKTHLLLNPKATAPLTGELTVEGLRLESDKRVSWSSHDGLVSCTVNKDQLTLCHDPQGFAVKILPLRGFRNPELATRFLKFQAQQVSELNLLKPLQGPSMVGDRPTDAIGFGGVVIAKDLKTSPLENIRKRNVNRMFIWLAVLIVVIVPVVGIAFNPMMMLIAVLVIFFVCFLTIKKIRAATNSDPELPLIVIQGWLNAGEIALLHNIGQSRSGWLDFRLVGFNEACIWLHTYGGKNSFVLLPRRFFANDDQWQAAVGIAASHSAK